MIKYVAKVTNPVTLLIHVLLEGELFFLIM